LAFAKDTAFPEVMTISRVEKRARPDEGVFRIGSANQTKARTVGKK